MHTRVASLLMPATAPKWRGAFRKSFQANGGLLYKTNFLEPSTYEDVRKECRSLRKHFKRELDSIATGRLGCCLDSRSQAYLNLMTDDISTVRTKPTARVHRATVSNQPCAPSLASGRRVLDPQTLTLTLAAKALSGVTGVDLFPSDYPVECRLYTPKASMDWHQDDELYVEPQALQPATHRPGPGGATACYPGGRGRVVAGRSLLPTALQSRAEPCRFSGCSPHVRRPRSSSRSTMTPTRALSGSTPLARSRVEKRRHGPHGWPPTPRSQHGVPPAAQGRPALLGGRRPPAQPRLARSGAVHGGHVHRGRRFLPRRRTALGVDGAQQCDHRARWAARTTAPRDPLEVALAQYSTCRASAEQVHSTYIASAEQVQSKYIGSAAPRRALERVSTQ